MRDHDICETVAKISEDGGVKTLDYREEYMQIPGGEKYDGWRFSFLIQLGWLFAAEMIEWKAGWPRDWNLVGGELAGRLITSSGLAAHWIGGQQPGWENLRTAVANLFG